MTVVCTYFSPTTPTATTWSEDLSDYIRLGGITGLSAEARLGATGVCSQTFDDAGSTIGHSGDGIVGLKQMFFDETACPAGNQRMWTGYIGPRTYRRGQKSLRLGSDREIEVGLVEVDDFLSFRVFAPEADDPTSDFAGIEGETDLERVQRLLTEVDFLSTTLFDIGYIPSTGGVVMSAKDYTGSRPIDVLNDCAQVSGRNFFVLYDEATNQLVLWYDVYSTDGSATLAYDSALRLTNVDSEHDGSTTFAVAFDANEVVDPSRVISAAYLTGEAGITGYRTLASTANTFAWRDTVAPSIFVKDQTKLNALGDRYLADNATEDPRIFCTVQLPAAKATGIHKGQRLEVHFTHLPNVSTAFTWTRVMALTIRQDKETPDFYWLDLELSPIIVPVLCPDSTPSATFPPLSASPAIGVDVPAPSESSGVVYGDYLGNLQYVRPGTTGIRVPTPLNFGRWHFPEFNAGGSGIDLAGDCSGNKIRIVVVGDGTLTIPIAGSGGVDRIKATLYHFVEGIGEVVDEVQEPFEAPHTFVFDISTAEQTICTHWVEIERYDGACGDYLMGYGPVGASWVLAP